MKETARFEVVDWDVDKIASTTKILFADLSRESGFFAGGPSGVIENLLERIRKKEPTYFVFEHEGLEMKFAGFSEPTPKGDGDMVIFSSKDPRLCVVDMFPDRPIAIKLDFVAAYEAVLEKTQESFGVGVESPPPTVVFTKEVFAKDHRVIEIPLLG